MTTGALVFMLGAWAFVLTLTAWSWRKLLSAPAAETEVPPPGTSL